MDSFVIEYTLDQVEIVARQCADLMQGFSVVTFTGSLGAGKTTLVSALLKSWGVQGPVTSPTFTYVNTYAFAKGDSCCRVYHFDLYRLETLGAFEQAGFSEYLYQKETVCLIEWPEIALPLLTHNVAHISIEFVGLDRRRLICEFKR